MKDAVGNDIAVGDTVASAARRGSGCWLSLRKVIAVEDSLLTVQTPGTYKQYNWQSRTHTERRYPKSHYKNGRDVVVVKEPNV